MRHFAPGAQQAVCGSSFCLLTCLKLRVEQTSNEAPDMARVWPRLILFVVGVLIAVRVHVAKIDVDSGFAHFYIYGTWNRPQIARNSDH